MLIRHSVAELRRVNMDRVQRSCVCVGETVGKIGKVDEMGERENLCLWSMSGAARNET